MYFDEYCERCAELIRRAPPSWIWNMEHGTLMERQAIATVKKYAARVEVRP